MDQVTSVDQRRARLAELAEMPVATHGETWEREREELDREIDGMNRWERSEM